MKAKPVLAVDGTGLGGPIVQQMRTVGLKPRSVVITSGNQAKLTGSDWSCPKALLLGELRLALHQQRLKVAQFHDRENLVSANGRASFEGVGDASDDQV